MSGLNYTHIAFDCTLFDRNENKPGNNCDQNHGVDILEPLRQFVERDNLDNDRKDEVLAQLNRLEYNETDHNKIDNMEQTIINWRYLERNTVEDEKYKSQLFGMIAEFGCGQHGEPFILDVILRRLVPLEKYFTAGGALKGKLDPAAAEMRKLADDVLDGNCPGARGLASYTREALTKWRDAL